jgi:beta-lactamase superfamily II metal-dependent hydrolase
MLTGDIERDGLAVLLSQPALKCDVLSSPHHGGVDGNTPQLAEWAKPGVVVASCGVRGVRDRLERVYGPKTRCFATFEDGAVVVNISPDGAMSVRSMLSGRGEGFAPDRSPKGEIAD